MYINDHYKLKKWGEIKIKKQLKVKRNKISRHVYLKRN